eukprot:TRINITY_DN443_c0_g2_i3.p1 TRINITY_DN443_c0_g2~~TRINITY_DN443_c0_g2_i3.p1  ORF type:complete len:254 (-),score=-28.68 TRINITY_DN443_c0_g2_i3:2853-3614(-)
MPGQISLSLRDAGHTNDLQINTACGPPRSFRHASTCPRLDHPASGRILMTPRTCIRRSSPYGCEHVAFASASYLKVSHCHLNTLPGPFYKTQDMTLAIMPVLQPRGCFLRIKDPLTPYRSIASRFQALLTSLLGVLFSFRSPYQFAIGLKEYLVLEVGASQIHARIPTHATQAIFQILCFFFFFFFSSRRRHTRFLPVSWARRCVQETAFNRCLRDYHTLWSNVPEKLNFDQVGFLEKAYNTTSPTCYQWDSV